MTHIILQQVQFKNDFLEVVKVAGTGAITKFNHQFWVSVNKVCENLGISFATQFKKLKSDPTYEAKLIEIQTNGGIQKVFCIPLSKLNGWLFSINPNRVKPEVREKLIAYKKECFDVLFNHFIKKAQTKITQPKLLPNCEEELEAIIKNSPQYNGLKGLVAKLENELARKQSEIKNLELKLEELNDPFGAEPVRLYVEFSQKKIKSYEQGFLNLKKELLAQINKVQEELLALEEILELHITEEKDFLYIAGNIIPKK